MHLSLEIILPKLFLSSGLSDQTWQHQTFSVCFFKEEDKNHPLICQSSKYFWSAYIATG